jgi:hypothetical protein
VCPSEFLCALVNYFYCVLPVNSQREIPILIRLVNKRLLLNKWIILLCVSETFFLDFVYIWKLNNTQAVSHSLHISRHNIDRIEFVLIEKLIENLHWTRFKFLFALSMYNVPRKYFTLPFIYKKLRGNIFLSLSFIKSSAEIFSLSFK